MKKQTRFIALFIRSHIFLEGKKWKMFCNFKFLHSCLHLYVICKMGFIETADFAMYKEFGIVIIGK